MIYGAAEYNSCRTGHEFGRDKESATEIFQEAKFAVSIHHRTEGD
jgi:hypothetical protein